MVILIECGQDPLNPTEGTGCQRGPLGTQSPSGIHQETMRAHSCRSEQDPQARLGLMGQNPILGPPCGTALRGIVTPFIASG